MKYFVVIILVAIFSISCNSSKQVYATSFDENYKKEYEVSIAEFNENADPQIYMNIDKNVYFIKEYKMYSFKKDLVNNINHYSDTVRPRVFDKGNKDVFFMKEKINTSN
ncbi:hypothetical protein [Myroides injenensis]|uniref:hypothetical protein n=1 Tax=Myroides injenensis TaxID=1183151 RepID=UPI000287C936|nr:hypothetical protein [Myroides injenensis]